MKNKKGFTIVELGVSICLVAVVAFLLFQVITAVKKVYTASDLKTTLLTKQAIMTKKIYDDLDSKTLSAISNCTDYLQSSCLQFVFSDSTTSVLRVDPLEHVVSYNNYSIDYEEIDENILFEDLVFTKEDDFFTIRIPISVNTLKGNYGVSITKQYVNNIDFSGYIDGVNNVHSLITIPLYDDLDNMVTTNIVLDGTEYWIRVYDASNTVFNGLISKQMKHLKLETCSNTDFTGAGYELKTPTSLIHWCQSNNFYTQNVGEFANVSVNANTALGKDTYIEALTSTGVFNDTLLDAKVTNFVDRYTFKSR